MEDIRIGVIGVGYLGYYHAAKLAAIPGVTLVGVADTRAARVEQVAAEFGAIAYTDYRDLLAEVEAVTVAVPTSRHYEVAAACIERNIDLLLEKPMTVTVEEADGLIELADQHQVIFQVGHLERYNPAFLAMEEYLTKPLFIESHRISVFKNRGIDVDVVLDLMIHDIDIILSIVQAPLASIHAVGVPVVTGSTDIANARLIFENGCTANVTVSRISAENMRRIRIFQPGNYVSVDYAAKRMVVLSLKPGFDAEGLPNKETKVVAFTESDALLAELTDFVGNVRKRSPPKVGGRDGRRALAVALEIIAQIKGHIEEHHQLLTADSRARP